MAASKVLHVRSLAEGATREELSALAEPFGTVSNVVVNVGPNRNQAFVEFADINSAAAMVEHFKASGGVETAMVRGKPCYVQYSNRQSIVNNPRDKPSRVILVTLESALARSVSVDIFQTMFSPFGTVQKVATFEKGKGLQALVQFEGVAGAQAAIAKLDGKPIPTYLVPTVGQLHMRISFSAHSDISVKFQGHHSRDYTNPTLPVAPDVTDPSQAAFSLPPHSAPHTGMGNILLVAVDNAVYPTTVEPLHTVFSKYGTVEKIAVFEKNNTPQALIQYADRTAAMTARSALQGHAVYEGGYNMLHITESNHADLSIHSNTDTSWDYTGGKAGGGAAARHDWPRDRGGEPQNVTGIDYEQAHEAVIKAVQQVMSGQAALPSAGQPMGAMGASGAMYTAPPPPPPGGQSMMMPQQQQQQMGQAPMMMMMPGQPAYGMMGMPQMAPGMGMPQGMGMPGGGIGGMPGYPQMPQMPGQPGMGLPPHMQPRMH